ncbi:DivIVA domain-containing protein [Bacillus sp. CECT 9360]|uniref:DivIVA domain-containing protein n=1 Tax=Bacillus sp. CECT 9360 TaxID=2845821 RepID=UPI001E54B44B|nr:DivIVA domain-containing protein [Bacillus sp. CECT 9360]
MTVEKVPTTNEKIHPNILLNKEIIHNKAFKKRAFGGYDIDEVNGFYKKLLRELTLLKRMDRTRYSFYELFWIQRKYLLGGWKACFMQKTYYPINY